MRNFFQNLRKNDRGDQVVGWIVLAALVAVVGGTLFTNILPDLNVILGGVDGATSQAANLIPTP